MHPLPTLPLDHPIWGRLYGPHGLQDVAGILCALSEKWDDQQAQDLFREKLHHQEDLYPATYAALPWLWNIAISEPAAREETACFLSWVIRCALAHRANEQSENIRYRGLSLDVESHQHSWIAPDLHPTKDDIEVLRKIETVTQALFENAEPFLLEQAKASVPETARHILVGVAALRKGHVIADALGSLHTTEGHSPEVSLLCLQCGTYRELQYSNGHFKPLEDALGAADQFVGFQAEPEVIKFRREDIFAERDVALFLLDEFEAVDLYLSVFLKAYLCWACGSDEDLPHYDPVNAVDDLLN